MSDILFVDDDAELLQSLARALSPRISPLTMLGVSSASRAIEAFQSGAPLVAVVDLCLDERVGVESGFELLRTLRERDSTTRLVVLTGHGSLSHGIKALMLGASSFIEKPVDPAHLAAVVVDAAAQARLRRAHARSAEECSIQRLSELVGRSRAIREVREQIDFIATTTQPVLLTGETGTGKGLCARLIHACSPQAAGQFIHYVPHFGSSDLAQSELFGHLKGSFTGATEVRRGLVSRARSGTLFIDEVDEVPADVQVRLLDLIQEGRYRAVGSDRFENAECRFLAATNRAVDEALAQGKIRRDLFHRIAYHVVRLPPLRERLEDIPDICAITLGTLRARGKTTVTHVVDAALNRLSQYPWPGNVRELQAVIERSASYARFKGREIIVESDLGSLGEVSQARGTPQSMSEAIEELKVRLTVDTMRKCDGNQSETARALGIDRGTLRRILERGGVGDR